MLDLYTTHYIAAGAQRRHFDGVKLDGPITDRPSRLRTLLSALFTRSAPATGRARTRLGGVATA